MNVLPYVVVAIAGALNAVHSGTNAQLTTSLGKPWWAAIIVVVVSGAFILLGVGVSRESVPSLSSLAATPWWAWVGTACGAVPIITTLLYAGRLGGAAFNGLVVTVTIITSIVLDHFGLLGFSVHHANIWRIIGGLLMVGGITLVCSF
ncbi:DMT family transporter [Lichenicola sp.]|uniref:DMT family transporter n=1 Tax=Lichenicola sp. TaxID=2804529 RepID=UPI003B0065DD